MGGVVKMSKKEFVAFGFWLVNAPNKQFYSKKWIETKYSQYQKEHKDNIKR